MSNFINIEKIYVTNVFLVRLDMVFDVVVESIC